MAFGRHDLSYSPPARARPAARRSVPPWVATGVTALLLAGGFTRRRFEARRAERRVDGRELARGITDDRGRGRSAKTPADIPTRGWKDILIRVYRKISEDRVLAIAAAVTFYVILAIFPGLAALVSVYGLFADPKSIEDVLNSLSSALPGGVVDIIRSQLESLTSQPRGQLGATFGVSLVLSLWSANSGMKAIIDALNIVYHEQEKRSFLQLNAVSLLFTIGAIVIGLIGLALIAVLPPALEYLGARLGIAGPTREIISIARWPVLLVAVSFGIAVVFRYGPSREKPQWRWVTWGSAIASLLWLAASMLFSWYVSNFASYNKTYGSLAAPIIFMTWLWISVTVILIGTELDAEMEHQTARDTTTGHPKPLGKRGAHMADTVGAEASWGGRLQP